MSGDSFDYVVVGAGSSGCALARRLSDDPEVTVALIEAGGADDHPYISTPVEYFKLWGTDVDWQYRSVPQPNLGNRVLAMPRGRVLGGTSSINGMVYLRGASSDFDRWAEGGCAGWDWATVRGTYEDMEALLQPAVLADNNPLSEVFVEAALQAGFSRSATSMGARSTAPAGTARASRRDAATAPTRRSSRRSSAGRTSRSSRRPSSSAC